MYFLGAIHGHFERQTPPNRAQQAQKVFGDERAIGGEKDPALAFTRGIADDLGKVRSEERFAAGEGDAENLHPPQVIDDIDNLPCWQLVFFHALQGATAMDAICITAGSQVNGNFDRGN